MKILEILKWKLPQSPQPYSLFHLWFLIITVVATFLLCAFFKNANDKKFRKIILICWIIFTGLEIYKQFTYAIDWKGLDGATETRYNLYYLPYQFCSTPFFVLPFIIWLPEGKIRDAFMSFASSFILFAGVAVMLYPNDVFVRQLGIDIQTMVHHGMQVVLGVFIAVYNRNRYLGGFKKLVKWYWPSVVVFAGFAVVAIILNEALYPTGQFVNYFFISSHFDCTLPVLSTVYAAVPYPVFLCLYLIGFAIVSAVMIGFETLFIKLANIKNVKAK